MQVIKRAWLDTWSSLGGWTVVYFVVAVPAVGFGLHYLISGTKPMSAEFEIWLIYGLAATGAVSLSLFAWNLACAPYRIQRDNRLRLEKELAQVRKQLGDKRDPRNLNSEQKSILTDAIRSTNVNPQKIHVVYTPLSEEAADFASDLVFPA